MGISKIDKFLNKLRLWQKFLALAILGVLLVAAPFALYFNESSKVIHATEKELEGIQPANLFLQALKYSQQHRGLSMVVLNGDDSANSGRMQAQGKAEEAFVALDNIIENDISDDVLSAIWFTVMESWNHLKNEVNNKSISPESSFNQHTNMISQLIRIKALLLQHYGLSFDPEAQGFYLIDAALEQAPMISELFGQARAIGSGLLTRGNVSSQERMHITVLVNRSREHLFSLMDSMDGAMRQYEHLQTNLSESSNNAMLASMDAIDLANTEIIDKLALNYSATEYFATYTTAIEAQFKFIDAAISELNNVLNNRLINLNNNRYALSAAVIIISLLAALINLLIIRALLRQLGGEPDYTASVLNEISHGNLAVNISMQANDNSSLIYSMHEMRERLSLMVYDVRQSAQSIASASAQIVAGNLDLSSRTDQQASSLQETAATTEQITSTVQQNHANADQANALVIRAAETAQEGGEIVANLVQSMGEINQKSQQMSDILNVIDSIAFQTNILALNAAVEAARAGEQGRGFAVVASEVRALAQRSASAAQEIKVLIDSSVTSANQGNEQAQNAGNIMQSVVNGIQSVTSIMSEINVASREQANAIAEINSAVLQMDDVTRQNASLVEESAAAAASLQKQADQLVQLVANFRIIQNVHTDTP